MGFFDKIILIMFRAAALSKRSFIEEAVKCLLRVLVVVVVVVVVVVAAAAAVVVLSSKKFLCALRSAHACLCFRSQLPGGEECRSVRK